MIHHVKEDHFAHNCCTIWCFCQSAILNGDAAHTPYPCRTAPPRRSRRAMSEQERLELDFKEEQVGRGWGGTRGNLLLESELHLLRYVCLAAVH